MQEIRLLGKSAGAVAVKMQLRVVRSAKTGLLDFYYRLFTGAAPLNGPTRMAFLWSPPPANIQVTLADVRSEGVATTAPDDFRPLDPAPTLPSSVGPQSLREDPVLEGHGSSRTVNGLRFGFSH